MARNAGKAGKARKVITCLGFISFLAFPCPVRCPQDLSHWGRLSSLSRSLYRLLLTVYQNKKGGHRNLVAKD